MQQIDQDQSQSQNLDQAPSVRRRFTRPAVLVPLASAALAGALLVTLSVDGRGPATGATPSAAAAGASVTLNRIATAAMASDAIRVRDDQFVYVRTLLRVNKGDFSGPIRMGALHTAEQWMAQDPDPLHITGWLRESGKDAIMPDEMIPIENTDAVPAGLDHPTYRWLASLPTDPDALLRRLSKAAKPVEGESRNQAVFS